MPRPTLAAITIAAVLVALAAHCSREAQSGRRPAAVALPPQAAVALPRQRLQSLEEAEGTRWELSGAVQEDAEPEVSAGTKVLNNGHLNWYWIPPSAEPPAFGLPRLDASGVAEGAVRALSPMVLDHVFTTENGQQAWANVHAFKHGELLTGQMQLVHQPHSALPSPPERHVDLDGVLHGVVDEVNLLELLLEKNNKQLHHHVAC